MQKSNKWITDIKILNQLKEVQETLNKHNIQYVCLNNILTTKFYPILQIQQVINEILENENITPKVAYILTPLSGDMCKRAYEIRF